jgi:hypothetical protein
MPLNDQAQAQPPEAAVACNEDVRVFMVGQLRGVVASLLVSHPIPVFFGNEAQECGVTLSTSVTSTSNTIGNEAIENWCFVAR